MSGKKVANRVSSNRQVRTVKGPRWRAVSSLVFVSFLFAPLLHAEDARVGVLELLDGNTVEGRLVAGVSADHVHWHGLSFMEPFQFRLQTIKSIKFPPERDQREEPDAFAFELHNGDLITGRPTKWSRDFIEIRSGRFGNIGIQTASIHRLYRIAKNPSLVFAGLSGLQNWISTASASSEWQEEGNQLWTDSPGATLYGDFDLPRRAVVEFELSWDQSPDFVLAIGLDADTDEDMGTDGWRFETSSSQLTVLRETSESADVDRVADLSNVQRIRLTAFLDRDAGEMHVLLADGTPAAKIKTADATGSETESSETESSDIESSDIESSIGGGVRLTNRGSNLRLERLRIARWLGKLPTKSSAEHASIALSDGSYLSGEIQGMDTDSSAIVIGAENAETPVPIDQISAIKLASAPLDLDPPKCALFLHGGLRLSGELEAINEDAWVLSGSNLQSPVHVPRSRVRTLVVFDHEPLAASNNPSLGRIGRLEIGEHELSGRLTPSKEETSAETGKFSCLRWHPLTSRTASNLQADASGRIVFRDRPSASPNSTAARALAMQQLRLRQQRRGLNFGELFLARTDTSKTKKVNRDVHVTHVRSGDVIACLFESIDQRGVHLSTSDSEHGFVPHENMKAIELATHSPPPDLIAAKRERLLTLPRLQKSAPPTHLLCSHNGDFLRCRLIQMNNEEILVEVQLSEITIPRDRVAQIIWFHQDEMEIAGAENGSEPVGVATDSPFRGLVQVVKSDGKRVTFDPVEVTEDKVAGVSEILGECSFKISDMDHLLFGSHIRSEVSDLAYKQWKLTPAIEPLVAQEFDSTGNGSDSRLVGSKAPDVRLEMLDGGDFQLSQYQGEILVLDFWATWCAPCMQTMPLVEAAIAEFDPNQVRLVSVNLQEPAEHVRGVLERAELNLTVALDIDGVAAQRYEARAIPQMVIIDREGTIRRLYVGGGSQMVEQMKAAIEELLQSPNP